jgi:hypothetical protein
MDVPGGPGSAIGMALVDFTAMHTLVYPRRRMPTKLSKDEKLDLILKWLRKQTAEDLILIGIRKTEENELLVDINERPLNRIDAEHMMCKIYLIYELLPGGGRAFSHRPKLWFHHCHPIKGYFSERLKHSALELLRVFKARVEASTWISPVSVTPETGSSEDQELGGSTSDKPTRILDHSEKDNQNARISVSGTSNVASRSSSIKAKRALNHRKLPLHGAGGTMGKRKRRGLHFDSPQSDSSDDSSDDYDVESN